MGELEAVENIESLAYIGWLYLVQGIPYGLQDKFIPVQLRSKGLSYSSVSLLKVLFTPWATKGLWAPIVEVWGGRHRWLFVSLLALGITSYVGSHIALENVVSIGCMLLSLNTFSAVQDVAVDGIALQVLPEEQLGLGNTIQVVLYKVGWLVGGAGFTYLISLTDWSVTFVVLALIYLLTAILVTIVPTTDGVINESEGSSKNLSEVSQDNQNDQVVNHNCSLVKEVYVIFKDVISTPGTFWLCIYVLLYKMGERGAVNNMPLFLLDEGMSANQLGFWNGIVSQGLSIFGSFYGGVLLAKKSQNVRDILVLHSVYRFLAISFQFFIMIMWDLSILRNLLALYTFGVLSICSLSFSSGFISTASFTLMMKVSRVCEKKTQASHYSFLASLEVTGKLLFAVIAGFIIDYVGITSSFALFALLSFLPILILKHIPTAFSHMKTD